MSQHIGKLCRSLVSSFLLFLLVDVGVSGGSASKENVAVTHVTTQPSLLATPEPWHLLVTQTPAKEKAKEGESVVLNCHINSPRHPSLTDLMVKWYKEDEKGQMDLLENNVTVLPNNSRIFMSGDLTQGDASLTILNVTASDHGIYFCEVMLPDRKVVTGDGTKLRIRRALGLFGIEESIGTIIGVVAAGIGGVVILIIVLTPQLRRCILCMRQGSHQVGSRVFCTSCPRHSRILLGLLKKGMKEEPLCHCLERCRHLMASLLVTGTRPRAVPSWPRKVFQPLLRSAPAPHEADAAHTASSPCKPSA